MSFRHQLAALLLIATAVPATTFERLTTAQLSRRATRICAVKCESSKAVKDPESGLVFTHVRLRLLEDLKGRTGGATVELRLAGGEADGIRTIVPGMPRFKPGEECVVLLGARNRDGYATVVAARRGVLRLARDKKGQRYLRDRIDGFSALKGKRRVALASFRAAVKSQQPKRKDPSK